MTLISTAWTCTAASSRMTMMVRTFILITYKLMKEEREQKTAVTVEELAFRKIVYHLLRYPASKVTGVLVAKNKTNISNAYPLFHTSLLNPTFSVALDLIDGNLRQDQSIVGFYELVEGSEPKINGLIEANPLLKDMITMRVWADYQRKIQFGSPKYNFVQPEWSKLQAGLKRGDYRLLVDMDAHFQEIELDFRNSYLD